MIKVDCEIQQGSFSGHYKFSADAGVIGVFGSSGHGKTTLLNLLSGLQSPIGGEIELNGRVLYSFKNKVNVKARKRNIAYVFQDYRLFPHLSVYKNLKYALPRKGSKSTVVEMASLLGIEHLLSKKPSQCSGGEKQRIAIGRSLLLNPELLLMDEPFSAIDIEKREELMQYIKIVANKFHIPVLIVSHNFEDMLKLIDKVMFIDNGQVSYYDDVFQVLSNPDFIANEKIFKQFNNLLKLTVSDVCETLEGRLYETVHEQTGMRFLVESYMNLQTSDEVHVALSPDDIVMATRSVHEISTSNQIKGTVLRIIELPYMIKCVVDVGFLVLVTITVNAYERLGISLGDMVWLQFKTTKLNVAAVACKNQAKMNIA